MICTEYKCIFIHIPKTGGQSVETFFLHLLDMTWEERAPLLLRYNSNPKDGPERLAHLLATEYTDLNHISKRDFDQYFKFSFVRNPWARIVSEYRYRGLPKTCSFRDFIFQELPEPGLSNDYRHIIPQYNYLYDAQGNLLADFVGRFENLQADFDFACDKLGVAHSTLSHVNVSKKDGQRGLRLKPRMMNRTKAKNRVRSYTEYYDDETKKKSAKCTKKI